MSDETDSGSKQVANTGRTKSNPRRRRWRRRIGWLLVSLGGLLSVLLIAVQLLLSSLNTAYVKGQVRKAVKDAVGLHVDYGSARIGLLSGIHLEELVVRSEAPYDKLEQNLLRVHRVVAPWSVFAAIAGRPPLSEIHLGPIEVAVVQEDGGPSSLDLALAKLPKSEPSKEPPVPLSRILAESIPKSLPFKQVHLDGVSLRLLTVSKGMGKVLDQVSVSGLVLQLDAERTNDATTLRVSSPKDDLVVTRKQGEGALRKAEMRLRVLLDVSPKAASANLGLSLLRQNLAPDLPETPVREILDLGLSVDPKAGHLVANLSRLGLLDGVATATARAAVPDVGNGTLEEAKLALNLLPVARFLPSELGKLSLKEGGLDVSLKGLELSSLPRFHKDGNLDLKGRFSQLSFHAASQGGPKVDIGNLQLSASGSPGTGERDGLSVQVEMPLSSVHAQMGDAGHFVDRTNLSLQVKGTPTKEGFSGPLQATLKAPIGLYVQESKGAMHSRLELRDGYLGLLAQVSSLSPPAGGPLTLELRAGSLVNTEKGASQSIRKADLRLQLADLALNLENPLFSKAQVTLVGRIADLSSRSGGSLVSAQGTSIDLSTKLTGAPPYALKATVPIGSLSINSGASGKKSLLTRTPARLELSATEVQINDKNPAQSTGRAQLTLDLGKANLKADLRKSASSADFDTTLVSESLAIVAPFLDKGLVEKHQLPLAQMGVVLSSKGRLAGVFSGGAPQINHKTSLVVKKPAFRSDGRKVAAAEIAVDLSSSGGTRKHAGSLDLRMAALRLQERLLGDGKTRLAFDVDLGKPRLELHLAAEGNASPEGKADVVAEFKRPSKEVALFVDVHLSKLAALEPLLSDLLPGQKLQTSGLTIDLHTEGQIQGVVRDFTPAGRLMLFDHPADTAAGTFRSKLQLKGLSYDGKDGLHVASPALDIDLSAQAKGQSRNGSFAFSADRLDLISGEHQIHGERLKITSSARLEGDPLSGEGDASLSIEAQKISDRALKIYPITNLQVRAKLDRKDNGAIRLQEFLFDNPGGGTKLTLRGGLDLTQKTLSSGRGRMNALKEQLIYGRKSLALSGTLRQKLSSLVYDPADFSASGDLQADIQIESADQALFHTVTLVQLDKVGYLAKGKQEKGGATSSPEIRVKGVTGQVPIVQDIVLLPEGGYLLLQDAQRNAYPRLRFADHQPFLNLERNGQGPEGPRRTNFLSVEEVRYGGVILAPLAGNLRIDRNLIWLDQLDMALRGGQVRGRLLVDYRGDDSEIEFQGSATSIRPSQASDDRLDLSTALTFGLKKRNLEGRIELYRIGRKHLLDLVNSLDPYEADVSMGRIRLALKLGYPEKVRLRFEQGFINFYVKLGGLVQAVRIDEVRGIPLGPVVERYLSPVLGSESEARE